MSHGDDAVCHLDDVPRQEFERAQVYADTLTKEPVCDTLFSLLYHGLISTLTA